MRKRIVPSDPPELVIAVISDLHVYDTLDPGDTEPSFINASAVELNPKINPVEGLKKLIEDENLKGKVKVLLCAGDIGNKAKPSTIKHGWGIVHTIASELGCEMAVAVPGNHDHDSRSIFCEFDPKYILQELTPAFPSANCTELDKFWSQHYAIIDYHYLRLVILNSSAYHGIRDEYGHGRIAPRILRALIKDLEGREDCLVKIMMFSPPSREKREPFSCGL